jgi:two-component system, sensor histidine kinase and response regulator
MEYLQQRLLQRKFKPEPFDVYNLHLLVWKKALAFFIYIKLIGINTKLTDYDRRKLEVFNVINTFQLFTGILVPIIGLMNHKALPANAWLIACLPAIVSFLVLYLNYRQQYFTALLSYFILYPFFTCIVYLNGFNLGLELYFILYGVLAVFFLNISYMLFTIAFSMVSYFVLMVIRKNYQYQLASVNIDVYVFNQVLAILFIYYGLYLLKKEITEYQQKIVAKNKALQLKNDNINIQKNEIALQASLLQDQTEKLTELNNLKNKMFSVIAHDLKSPIYAMRNLFQQMQYKNIPAEDVKSALPEISKDLNYTIGLLDNLLHWAKSQMEVNMVKPETIDLSTTIKDVCQLLRLQAEVKQVKLESNIKGPILVHADKEMINLILRNLISNAIKYTGKNGTVTVGAHPQDMFIEVYVKDTGMGISKEALKKISENNYFTTKGTASEAGTGLGLILCKDFLRKNKGRMFIESQPGRGSTFSFTLPCSFSNS